MKILKLAPTTTHLASVAFGPRQYWAVLGLG